MRVRVGSLEALQTEGRLLGKAAGHGVCVFWADGRAYALDDRCPHMGFPLHRGTVEAGLVTCHWHHARFDLASGGTLDPFADDARAFPVEVEGDDVYLVVNPPDNRVDHLRRRLAEGLEGGLTVLVAMANLLPWLDEDDHAVALVHGLAFVARDTANRPPRFPLAPLGDGSGAPVPVERLTDWYRRFVETRSGDAA